MSALAVAKPQAAMPPPMLAAPVPADFNPMPGEWVVEEKFDGHRLLARVDAQGVTAWSRNGLERALPAKLVATLAAMPAGLYDGELVVPGERSFGVTVLLNEKKLEYRVFDALELLGTDLIGNSYDERRGCLEVVFQVERPGVTLSIAKPVNDAQDIAAAALEVWARDGEGLIVKRRSAAYYPGKRSKDWLKIKKLRTAVLTVTGFREGLLGPRAVVMLRDDAGIETTVKVLNNAELARISDADIGRKLRIEYQEKTPDGRYRHGRWDRWEDQ